jgi:hypothetical protein
MARSLSRYPTHTVKLHWMKLTISRSIITVGEHSNPGVTTGIDRQVPIVTAFPPLLIRIQPA